jgi:hypothetical protein
MIRKQRIYMIFDKKQTNTSSVKIGNHNFEIVNNFKYLGTTINNENRILKEIQTRITMGNRCCFKLNSMLKNKLLSLTTKSSIYNSVIRPVVTYGGETWNIGKVEENKLVTWERKILRKICGPICENGIWKRRWNNQIIEIFKSPDIVATIRSNRLRWAGHLLKMNPSRTPKSLMDSKPERTRSKGEARMR